MTTSLSADYVSVNGAKQPTFIIDTLQVPTLDRRWFEYWNAGKVACVSVTVAIWENARETISIIQRWKRYVAENSDLVEIATSVRQIKDIAATGRTAVLLNFQNTGPIEHDIDMIGNFRDLGVCIMQLTYNLQNFIGAGYWEEVDSGLSSRFGRKAIEEMNRVGVMVDVSHCGDRTSLDAINYSSKPVAITHANPREFVGNPAFGTGRLKPTEVIKAMAARGGVIGLSPEIHMTAQGLDLTRDQFCEMVAWTVDLVGIDSVAFGSDYCPGHDPSIRTWWRYGRWSRERAKVLLDNDEGWPEWIATPQKFPSLKDGLEARGFSNEEVEKILTTNWLRMFDQTFVPEATNG